MGYKVYTVACSKIIMRYLAFLLFVYMMAALAYAGPQDKWVYIGPTEEQEPVETQPQINGIALLLAVAAFAWVYVIYRDLKGKKRRK